MKFSTTSLIILLIFVQSSASFNFNLKSITQDLKKSLSRKCRQQVLAYIENLSLDLDSWALKMLDATSKIQSGIISLNYGELGNFDQCTAIKTPNQTKTGPILGKYCLGSISKHSPKATLKADGSGKMQKISFIEKLGGAYIGSLLGPKWAVCVPHGCLANETEAIVKYFIGGYMQLPVEIQFDELYCQTAEDVSPSWSVAAIMTIAVLLILLAVTVVTSLFDICYWKYGKRCPYTFITAFSAFSNGRNIFQFGPSGNLSCLNGLKFWSMMWLLLAHQYLTFFYGPLSNTKDVINFLNSWYSMFILHGKYGVDTFLLITGTIISYNFMMNSRDKKIFSLFRYYIYKYLRFTPALGIVTLANATLLKHMGSGPRWPYINHYYQQNCANYWWSTLLYVQNYVNVSKMCLDHSWYLNVDMQLYILSPIILFLFVKKPEWSMYFMTKIILGVSIASFTATWVNQLTVIESNFYGNYFDHFIKNYVLTHTRAAPWLIGILLGDTIFKIKAGFYNCDFNKFTTLLLWFVCFDEVLGCILYGFRKLRAEEYHRYLNAIHSATVRHAWSFALSWIIIACLIKKCGPLNWVLSFKIYRIFNRFIYSIFLVSLPIMYWRVYSKKTAVYFSHFNVLYEFCGTMVLSTLLAILLVFMVEAPIGALENVAWSQGLWKKRIVIKRRRD